MNEMIDRAAKAMMAENDKVATREGEIFGTSWQSLARAAIVAIQNYYREKYGFILSDILPDINEILDEPPT